MGVRPTPPVKVLVLLLPLLAVVGWVVVRARGVREDQVRMAAALARQGAAVLPRPAAVGARSRTEPEQYRADNLVDWVDGGAEALLEAGFRDAAVATYTFVDGTEAEVAVVTFTSGEAARSWLEEQRPRGARTLSARAPAWVSPDVAGAVRGRAALRVLAMVPGKAPERVLATTVQVWLRRSSGG